MSIAFHFLLQISLGLRKCALTILYSSIYDEFAGIQRRMQGHSVRLRGPGHLGAILEFSLSYESFHFLKILIPLCGHILDSGRAASAYEMLSMHFELN